MRRLALARTVVSSGVQRKLRRNLTRRGIGDELELVGDIADEEWKPRTRG